MAIVTRHIFQRKYLYNIKPKCQNYSRSKFLPYCYKQWQIYDKYLIF